eukprot:8332483-Pyramimonas_sp.AAC.1
MRRVDGSGVVSIAVPVQRAIEAAARHAGAPSAAPFSSKAFRRGRAETRRRCNGRLCEILRGADWSSRAFKEYLDVHQHEGDATAEAAAAA